MKVESDVKIYEIDDKDEEDTLGVLSHWNIRNFVRLQHNGQTITVAANELIRAIEAAQKAHPF